ncbi:MAG: glutathione S-transferase family protein [Thermoanaerobaculales bacterium]|jgi:glutathione S-transferase|nr:glutathione S-transferase family protein [Thermoanaerobaculales bacterium]
MDYYYHPMSPNCRKVSALLEILGVEANYKFVDLAKGKHATPTYLAINPNGMVPALLDGKKTVLESNCILIHLAEKTGSELWSEAKRLEILQWMFWEQSHFMYATGILFFQKLLKPLLGKETDEVRVDEAMAKFRRHAQALDDHLKERDWLVGDAMSLADLAVAANLTYAEATGMPMDEFPNVQRWYGTIEELDAWKATHPALAG